MKLSPWWLSEDGESPHTGVNSAMASMRANQLTYRQFCFDMAERYGMDLSAFGGPSHPVGDSYSVNALANIVDTLHSQLADRILPMPLTTRGDFRQVERARNLGYFIKGTFQEAGVFDLQLALDLDVLLFGFAVVKSCTTRDDRLGVERVPPWELFFDDLEARYGKPRSVIHEFLVDRGVLLEKYDTKDSELYGSREDRVRAIEHGTTAPTEDGATLGSTSDMVMVRQAYHLPSGPTAKDGRVCVCTSAGTLYAKPWTRKTFPYRYQTGTVPLAGIRGDSLVRRLAPAQAQYDKLNEKLDTCHELMAIPRIIIQRGAHISTQTISDLPGKFIMTDGPPPQEWNAQPVHPDTYAFRDAVRNDMNMEAGVSQMSSQSDIPAGLRNASGIALQTFEDVESRRHKVRHRLREKFVLEIADMLIEEAEERGDDYSVRAINGKHIEFLNWKDVKLDREQYVLDVMPTSFLAKTPSAKFAQLRDMRNSGDITPMQFKQLAEIPDLESEVALDVADFDIVKQSINRMMFEGVYVAPEPFDNVAVAKDLVRKYINHYRANGATETELGMLRQYADEVVMMEQAMAPPPPPPPPMMPPPTPDGMAPPAPMGLAGGLS